MAKQTSKPVTPDFRDVDAKAVQAAQAALAGGNQEPLTPAKNAKVSQASNGSTYTRWTERIVVQQAYRSVSKKGLLDVAVIAKIRQGEKNNGKKVFAHFYLNMSADVPEKHVSMNERSLGAVTSLLLATGFMPAGGALKGTLLNKMFPPKGAPGTASPLAGKTVVGSIVQQYGPAKDQKTGKPLLDENDEPVMEKRDSAESFLPDTSGAAKVAETDEDTEE
jgi:hypothetical protein